MTRISSRPKKTSASTGRQKRTRSVKTDPVRSIKKRKPVWYGNSKLGGMPFYEIPKGENSVSD